MGLQEDNRHLEDADRKYIWHPFTQMREWEEATPVIITEGRGSFVKDSCGRWYLDGVSSLWVNIFGHRKKEIDDAIKAQVDRISHSTLLGLSNEPAIRLAEKLVTLMNVSFGQAEGPPPAKVFYSDNGSTAVEVALKMAFQYWQHRGETQKRSFLSLNNAYHGDTLGAVSVGGVAIFHEAFGPLLFQTYKAPSPYCYRCELGREYPACNLACADALEEIMKNHHQEIAGLIIEPLVQAAGGMIVSPTGYLRRVHELCSTYDLLLIADEVATGFGRTGRMFASEHENVVPDIICLSKGITGGYMPLAATVATEEIYRAFLGEFKDLKTFFHGHSYTGNPLACAAAVACLDIFAKEDTLREMKPKIELLDDWLRQMQAVPHVGNVRSRGLMAGLELVLDEKTKEPYDWQEKIGWKVAHHALDNGVFIRPLGNVIVVMPPLNISIENLGRLLTVLRDAVISATA
ncbi:MAG: adenosylmethionine--8-amino-7-oxononanoate transaminase [Nitrospirae bacterium]|nr:adenosylmethionine--8-amino-7-oxononanoate transaminase [Nitrospirota bacterium]